MCVGKGEEEGGNEQSSGFKLIYLKIIVNMYGLQTICLALANELESEGHLEAEFPLS